MRRLHHRQHTHTSSSAPSATFSYLCEPDWLAGVFRSGKQCAPCSVCLFQPSYYAHPRTIPLYSCPPHITSQTALLLRGAVLWSMQFHMLHKCVHCTRPYSRVVQSSRSRIVIVVVVVGCGMHLRCLRTEQNGTFFFAVRPRASLHII